MGYLKALSAQNEEAMDLAELFLGSEFKRTIRRYCEANELNISELTDTAAVLKFEMDSGKTQTLYIIKYGTSLEFSCPSGKLKYDSIESMPHQGSTLLLLRSKELTVGFWCIEKVKDIFVYSFMHNAELSLINSEYFGKVVYAVVNELEKFETSF